MSEPWLRLGVLAAVALVAVIFWWRARPERAVITPTHRTDLAPGVYLFTSETCAPCVAARKVAKASLGDRVHEIRFEDHPGGFGAYQIAKVPTLLIVHEGGRALLLEGVPTRRQLKSPLEAWGP